MTHNADLCVITSCSNGLLTARVEGALDFDTGDHFTRALANALAEHPQAHTVLLDCTELGHVDSLGLATLLMLRRRLVEDAVRLRIEHRPAALDRVLEITGTRDHLLGAPAEDTARSAVS
ncbi:STAS domain-containing protein [Streptomyces sp. SID8379]|uniref:STAS domain-containing protein n=1 Tax=unclassified Streptomyces TaxID=2593676 RepID=UPI00035CCF49|nr:MULTISPECIES: STAS domain-containing protein [unclassified Streptomyces]MYW63150.1 STAS domain-containing protein [Streptomyces sp. SID8379]